MARLPLVILGFVLVVAALFLAWPRGSEEQPVGARGSGSAPRVGERTAGATDGEIKEPPAALQERSRVEPVMDLGPRVLLRVVDPQGAPIVGAVVHFQDGDGPATALGSRLWRQDREQWLERFGKRTVADGEGIASWSLPEPPPGRRRHLVACARHGGLWGETWIPWEPGTEVLELRLQVDVGFRVQVVDGAGSGVADVQVAAQFTERDADFGDVVRRRELGWTGADGALHVAHVQEWRDRIVPLGTRKPATLIAALPGLDRAGPQIDVAQPPGEPVLLRLLPHGRIAVEVVGADGGAPEGGSAIVHEPWRGRPRPSAARSRLDDAGRAVVLRVGLGRRYLVVVRLGSAERQSYLTNQRRREVDGPRAPGEEVLVRFQLDAQPVLRGRLLFDGGVASEQPFQVSVRSNRARYPVTQKATTAGDGSFRVTLPARWIDHHADPLLVHALDAKGTFTGRSAQLRPVALSAREHDLGDVVLVEAPVLLTGRLVGEGDLGQVRLNVQWDQGDGSWSWRPEGVHVVRDSEGAFTVRGVPPVGALRLVVRAPRHLPVEPIAFVPGQRDLQVPLLRGGSARVRLAIGRQVGWITIFPELVPTDGRRRDQMVPAASAGARHQPESDRAVPLEKEIVQEDPIVLGYHWPSLWPGRYRLEVHAWGSPAPVLEVPDVVVRDGECTEDERLLDLDLTGLNYLRLQFPDLAARERPMPGLRSNGFVFVEHGGGLTEECVSVDGGFAFLAAAQPLDLLVDVHGFRRQRLTGVFENREVRLQPGLPVELRFDTEELPAGCELRLRLRPGDGAAVPGEPWIYSPAGGGGSGRYGSEALPCQREGTTYRVAVSAPGRYAVEAVLRRAGDDHEYPVVLDPETVDVPDAGLQRRLRIAEGEVLRALEKMPR